MEKISSSAFIVKRLSDNVNLGTVNADSMKIAKIIHSNNQDSLISTAIEENNESIDIHKEFNSNVTWGKLPYVSGSVDALI
ncbi:unnamed protein product [Rotaria magnacalcarata]|uniref:Uncharacterized protein n=1 Tax=Rotaria magnacalcarata TaxID=392030 RepID=A0A820KQZ9_9BILA|nr:unnamed protein product [Rotaria magnacalcarata]